jgi:uncharacterized protein (TIGR02246 family)
MRLKLAILAGLALCALAPYLATAQPPQNRGGGDKEIRADDDAFAAAFNKGDLDTLLGFWADDADYVDDTGATHKGKSSIADMMKENAAQYKGYTMKINVESVQFPRPDVALDEGSVTLTSPDGNSDSNRYLSVWVKNGDRWRLSNVHDLPATDKPDATAEPLEQFSWLVGEWSHKGENVTVNLKCRWALDMQYLVSEYDVTRPGGDSKRVVQWMGWDPASQQVRSWVFDSDGGNGQAVWDRDGNTWTSQSEGVLRDGKTGTSVNSIQFVDDSHFVWTSKSREIDDMPVPDVEMKFTRQGEAKKDGAKEDKP